MQPTRFPISDWGTQKSWDINLEESVRDWVNIGFTLVMSATVTDDPEVHKKAHLLLDLCAENGLQVMLRDARTIVGGANYMNPDEAVDEMNLYREKAQAVLDEFGEHPALWGLYVKDEPSAAALPAVARACRIIRELTDRVEPYVNLLPNHRIDPNQSAESINKCLGFTDYGAYLDHVVEECQAGMLSYDQYCSQAEEWGGHGSLVSLSF